MCLCVSVPVCVCECVFVCVVSINFITYVDGCSYYNSQDAEQLPELNDPLILHGEHMTCSADLNNFLLSSG